MKIKSTFIQYKKLSFIFSLLCVFAATTFIASPAGAEANEPNMATTANTDFYAYVEAGENLDTLFTKAGGTASGLSDTTLTLSRPGNSDETCTVVALAANGSACSFIDRTAPTDGIWRLSFSSNPGHSFTWSIDVQAGVTNIPGRVWAEQYFQVQTQAVLGSDFTYFYQDKSGFLYQATYRDYNGLVSALGASSLGLVESGGGCTPLYESVNATDLDYEIAPSNCQSYFKLFFESPAADLPASALKWDGTSEWVRPPITLPVVNNLAFVSTTPGSRSGDFNFIADSYTGLMFVDIDTDNNGTYTDPVDVTLEHVAVASSNSVAFDGLDGNGNPIADTRAISFRIRIDRQAEIHFLNQDVERRNGGIEVVLTNGASAGSSTLFWDDTRFANPDANRCSVTSLSNGLAGVDSTGGVHSWTNDAPCLNFGQGPIASWGNARIINDWTYANSNVSATFLLAGATPTTPTSPATPSAPNTGVGLDRDFTPLAIFTGILLTSIGIAVIAQRHFLKKS